MGEVSGKVIAVLGAAFKPNSDDVRDSPALDIAKRLHDLGAEVVVCDPQAIENARARHPEMAYQVDPMTALRGADAVLLLTEWREFVELDPHECQRVVGNALVIDGRGALNAETWRSAGWTFRALGRP